MEELPNGWTWEDAQERAGALIEAEPAGNYIDAFARYIAQHEKPPVDPDLMLLAREIAALVAEGIKPSGLVRESAHTSSYRSGEYDDEPEMVAILKLLKERKG